MLLLPALLFLLGTYARQASAEPSGMQDLTALLINDVYRIDGVDNGAAGGLARVRTLRKQLEQEDPELLMLHAGDILFPSMLSRRYKGEQMIDILNLLDGDASAYDKGLYATFGNHEFDKSKLAHAPMLQQRIDESRFTWLASNIRFADDGDGKAMVGAAHLKRHALIERNGIVIGLFSVTTDVKIPAYVASIGDPVETARSMTAMLREQGADLVVALTHLTMKQDLNILETLGGDGPDIVFGGHEHTRLNGRANGRYVFKADADARSALVARIWVNPSGAPHVSYAYRDLDRTVAKDMVVQEQVDRWLTSYDREYCASKDKAPGCLGEPLGRTAIELVGEELRIRSMETNLGNWVNDQALAAFREHGAQIAFLNAGSLRLNQDLPPDSAISAQTLSELFAYPMPLYMIRIDGATLQRVIEHAIRGWPGEGRWLQVAGFAWRHDSNRGKADGLTLLADDGPRPIRPDDTLLAVVNDFLIDPAIGDQDGYTMLNKSQVVDLQAQAPDLVPLVTDALKRAGEQGIAPAVEGRICSLPLEAGQPCLVVLPAQ